MRTVSIISIIRKYGLTSKRLNPKNRIKYADAIKILKEMDSSDLCITDVIDNSIYPEKSISHKCQVPGCNHKIRYEYILKSKKTSQRIVAGSTCVWPLLGLSKLEEKNFNRCDKSIREHHDMVEWYKKNIDVADKLKILHNEEFNYFKPFWEEVEYSRLTDEDTEFIRNVDVDNLIYQRDNGIQKGNNDEISKALSMAVADKEYKKVINMLDSLINRNPDNNFYNSLKSQVSHGYTLSRSQIRCIKIDANKAWYEDNIKGTPYDIMGTCDDIINPILKKVGTCYGVTSNYLSRYEVLKVNDFISKSSDNKLKLGWSIFKVKHEIVS